MLTGAVPYSQFSALPIYAPVRLGCDGSDENMVLYLADAEIARQAVNAYNILFGLGLGVTGLMGLYALSLFWHKRSETYLAWFAAYAGMLTLWSLGSLLSAYAPGAAAFLTRNAYGWSALLNLFLCFRMFGLPLPGRIPAWAAALGILALWCPLKLPISHTAWNLAHAALFLGSLLVLVWACAARRPGAWLALTGQALSQGLRMVMALSGLTEMKVGLSLCTIQYAKLFNLPFLLCGMWIISRKFAEQFTRSEQLSAQLEAVNRGLEQQVEQRTRALQEEQVQRVAFMVNAFHDLRTPLFVAQGCLDQLPRAEGAEQPLTVLRDRCVAWGDDLQLEQALQNLVTNALHHTPAGGVVTVRLYAEGTDACLEVRDTGPGIPPEEQDRVFLRYYRAPGAKRQGSSGLGLSIAQQIVVQHQGRITLDSRPGQGSAFTIRLPAVRRSASET